MRPSASSATTWNGKCLACDGCRGRTSRKISNTWVMSHFLQFKRRKHRSHCRKTSRVGTMNSSRNKREALKSHEVPAAAQAGGMEGSEWIPRAQRAARARLRAGSVASPPPQEVMSAAQRM